MTCLTNSSANRTILVGFVVCLFLSGCAAAPTSPTNVREHPPPLEIKALAPDRSSPQAAGIARVRWKADASGGAGERTFEFRIHDGKKEKIAQAGPSPTWDWEPKEPGTYRISVVVRDSVGTTMESGWYRGYRIVPRLAISSHSPDKPPPQAAEMATVRWRAEVTGGVGERTFEFRIHDGRDEKTVKTGSSPVWDWTPAEPGTYRVKVVARDAAGDTVESGWSREFGIGPKLVISSVAADKASPQAAETARIRWSADASGGIGERSFEFRITDGKEEKAVQKGPSGIWDWSPLKPGTFRVKVVVRDAIGNTVDGGWSPEYTVVPRLVLSSLFPDRTSPQAAEMAAVRWQAAASGGVGEHNFEFLIHDGIEGKSVQSGPSPSWEWRPATPGIYRVKVVAGDSIGNKVESGWSPEYVVAPPLAVSLLPPDKPSPQAAEMATVRWQAQAAGGVGKHSFEFRIHDGKEEKPGQMGPSPSWDWIPREAGMYRVKTVVRDSIGNVVESRWSPDYAVVPKLAVSSLSPDPPPSQQAILSNIRWTTDVKGGVGDRTYEFWKSVGKVETMVQSGPSASWEWLPRKASAYRVKVVARDSIGNTADSGWSPLIELGSGFDSRSLIAVMPLENLSGTPVPLKELKTSLKDAMKSKGFSLLEEDALEKFMEKHRVRYAGGLTEALGTTIREETGTKGVLFLSFELFDESDPPKIAFTARLVSTARGGGILWMDGVALAGNDSPGILGLGRIHDARVLWGKARGRIVGSLADSLAGKGSQGGRKGTGAKFGPKSFYKGTSTPEAGKGSPRIAVLPFRNESARRNAGEIMALHFLRGLSEQESLKVIEPGDVRQALLMSRTIMEGGLSLPQAEVLRTILDADLVLMGNVVTYEDYTGTAGNPQVNFSVRVLDTKSRRVTWSSISHNQGDDGVFLFDVGRVNTAHALASAMSRAVSGLMLP